MTDQICSKGCKKLIAFPLSHTEKVNILINHMNHAIRHNQVHRNHLSRVHKHVSVLNRNGKIISLRGFQARPICKKRTIAKEIGDNMILKQGLQFLRRSVRFNDIRSVGERGRRIGDKVCDVWDFEDPVDIARVGGIEISPDIEDRGEEF